MKKIKPSTFVLSVSDFAFFFVEGKVSKVNGPIYDVYYEKKPTRYKAENFVEVHGVDDKQTVINFTRDAMLNLTVIQGTNERADNLYNTFSNINSLVLSSDRKNPKLGKMKDEFAKAVLEYNEIRELLPKKAEIDYEDNYNLVNSDIKAKENITVQEHISEGRRKVKQITNSHEEVKGF